MTRLKVVDKTSGLLVAPIMYSDNYFSLTPGEAKRVTIEFQCEERLWRPGITVGGGVERDAVRACPSSH